MAATDSGRSHNVPTSSLDPSCHTTWHRVILYPDVLQRYFLPKCAPIVGPVNQHSQVDAVTSSYPKHALLESDLAGQGSV
ncbi:hypothetical protein TNCV_3296971 [Trichonephila clavipes]|uniref:Uncharacterized protein n=1 Tax=Trichonephila clavipes TaxID=2585209 RepID=A0A8X6T986_TRICX|nr:hypothetical protein TNCV_3296971 [Trichonephila clavipes]